MDVLADTATSVLAKHAALLDPGEIQGATIAQARRVAIDTFGILLAASGRPAPRIAACVLAGTSGGAGLVVGRGRIASPETAALLNGIAAHDLELDDTLSHGGGHPAAVLVSAALPAADIAPASTLGDLLAGLIAGYDVEARLTQAMGRGALHERGFHPTSVCGAVGAAACAGRVLRLSVEQMCVALGLAACQSSGLLAFQQDPSHMAKSFQAGVAARNGLTAALLAGAGFQGPLNALSGPGNLIQAFAGRAEDITRLTADLKDRFEIDGTSFKRHASCSHTHAAVDALLFLMGRNRIQSDAIGRIEVRLARRALPAIDGHPLWTHNIQHVLAIAALERRIEPRHFAEPWTTDPRVRALAARVELRGSADLDRPFPRKKGAVVAIGTAAATYAETRETAEGSPDRPLSTTDLRDKYLALAQPALGARTAQRLWGMTIEGPASAPLGPLLRILARRG